MSAGALAILISQNTASAAVPTTLITSTLQAAGLSTAIHSAAASATSAKIAAIAKGAIQSMALLNVKLAAVAMIAIGGAVWGLQTLREIPADQVAVNPLPRPKENAGKLPDSCWLMKTAFASWPAAIELVDIHDCPAKAVLGRLKPGGFW